MTSAGGCCPPRRRRSSRQRCCCRDRPAGRAAAAVATACGFPDAVTFDMGGTSTDVCLVRGGVPEPAPSAVVAGFPIRLPALDVHTIGAGGGSIARSTAAVRSSSDRRAQAQPPARRATAGRRRADGDRRPISCAGRIDPSTPPSPTSGASTPRAAHARARAGGHGRGRRRGRRRRGDGAGAARGRDGRAWRRSARPRARRVRWRRPLARVRASRRRSTCAVIVPPRAGALSVVGLLVSSGRRGGRAPWARPLDHDVGPTLERLGDEACRLVGADARGRPWSTAATPGKPHPLPSTASRRSRSSTSGATASGEPTPRSRWSVPPLPRRRAPPRSRSTIRRASNARDPGPVGRRGGRLHRLGPGGLVGVCRRARCVGIIERDAAPGSTS